MKREVDIKDISDGKFYGINDMVKADCQDCMGCSACCQGMGRSIILDPLDIFRLTVGKERTFEQLLDNSIELNVVDQVILPNLKMRGEKENCVFLNEEGRCGIHSFRPGICRIFPLGRYYDETRFQYFLQIHECKMSNRAKIKVKKWIDTPDIKRNEKFILKWHDFLMKLQERMEESGESVMKTINMFVLKQFYIKTYDADGNFYDQFAQRMEEAQRVLCL